MKFIGVMCIAFIMVLTIVGAARAASATSSWYGPGLYGNRTANGTVLTQRTWGVAHKTLPLGSRVRICRMRCVTVPVIDRGPFVYGRDFDLTYAAARVAGVTRCGVCRVYWRRVA